MKCTEIWLSTVNNAAVYHGHLKMWEVPEQEFDYVIDVNIKGTTNVLRHFLPLMIPKNQGVIVNLSSIYGRTGAALVCMHIILNGKLQNYIKNGVLSF